MSDKLRKSLRVAVIAVVCAAALAGCGRKGPLDPPPSAQIEQRGDAATPADSKKHLPIDVLID